jgi:probable rRNA maturation factor
MTQKIAIQAILKHPSMPKAAQLRAWGMAACEKPCEITIRIVGEDEGRALNLQFRGKDYATNVLTFDYFQSPVVMADVVICAPVLAREAAELGKPEAEHWAHLVVHGCLHAQGYDHETNARDAFEMEALESWLMMGLLGLPDPYQA